jgi:hypothetical protein
MKMMMKFGASVIVAAALVACGGGGGGGEAAAVASTNATAAFDTTNGPRLIRALDNTTFTFAGGVPALGTNAATTLTIKDASTGTPKFDLVSGSNQASGNISFGSCIFTVTSITPGTTLFTVGQQITVNPCTLQAAVAGNPAGQLPVRDDLTLTLGTSTSAPVQKPMRIASDGSVYVIENGVEVLVTTITVRFVTGTTGASS